MIQKCSKLISVRLGKMDSGLGVPKCSAKCFPLSASRAINNAEQAASLFLPISVELGGFDFHFAGALKCFPVSVGGCTN